MLSDLLLRVCTVKRWVETPKVLGTPGRELQVIYTNVPCRVDAKPTQANTEQGGTVYRYRVTVVMPAAAPDGTAYVVRPGDVLELGNGRVLEVIDAAEVDDLLGVHHLEVLCERAEGK